jgi:rfaE bifunctional protein kinase chain/domain
MSIEWSRFNRLTALIVGDVMTDRYLIGAADRLSPEAPVPVVQLHREESRLGGAANVALNVQAMGAKPILCSFLGNDVAASEFLELMHTYNLETDCILRSGTRMTTTKTRIMAGTQHLLRVDQEIVNDLSESEENRLLEVYFACLANRNIDIIIFQDYNKGVLTAGVIEVMLQEALRRGIPTAVDPKNKNFWAYRQVDLFKPNFKEIKTQYPGHIEPELRSLLAAAAFIRSKLDNKYALITLSEKGVFIEKAGEGHILPTQARKIADVSGAGDTVISVAGLCLALGLPEIQLAALANLAGGQVCEKPGVAPVNREELENTWELFCSTLS